jgi:hypothetical protein
MTSGKRPRRKIPLLLCDWQHARRTPERCASQGLVGAHFPRNENQRLSFTAQPIGGVLDVRGPHHDVIGRTREAIPGPRAPSPSGGVPIKRFYGTSRFSSRRPRLAGPRSLDRENAGARWHQLSGRASDRDWILRSAFEAKVAGSSMPVRSFMRGLHLGQAREPTHHHGIIYSVVSAGPKTWRWAVHPPESVLGWEAASGTVKGARGSAISAAKFEIERQERLTANDVNGRAHHDCELAKPSASNATG